MIAVSQKLTFLIYAILFDVYFKENNANHGMKIKLISPNQDEYVINSICK